MKFNDCLSVLYQIHMQNALELIVFFFRFEQKMMQLTLNKCQIHTKRLLKYLDKIDKILENVTLDLQNVI